MKAAGSDAFCWRIMLKKRWYWWRCQWRWWWWRWWWWRWTSGGVPSVDGLTAIWGKKPTLSRRKILPRLLPVHLCDPLNCFAQSNSRNTNTNTNSNTNVNANANTKKYSCNSLNNTVKNALKRAAWRERDDRGNKGPSAKSGSCRLFGWIWSHWGRSHTARDTVCANTKTNTKANTKTKTGKF